MIFDQIPPCVIGIVTDIKCESGCAICSESSESASCSRNFSILLKSLRDYLSALKVEFNNNLEICPDFSSRVMNHKPVTEIFHDLNLRMVQDYDAEITLVISNQDKSYGNAIVIDTRKQIFTNANQRISEGKMTCLGRDIDYHDVYA